MREHQLRPHCLTHAWANLTAELLHFSPAFSSGHVFQGAKHNDYRACNVWSVCSMCVCVCICHYYYRQKGFIVAVYGYAPQSASRLLSYLACRMGLWNILRIRGFIYVLYVLLKFKQDSLPKKCVFSPLIDSFLSIFLHLKDNSPKNENIVITYSSSCCSKPVWLFCLL